MKPRRIILLRHAQSEGNVDRALFRVKPDHAMEITDLGRTQAKAAGLALKELFGDEAIQFYVSPYRRARQTFDQLLEALGDNPHRAYEEPRLREQDWGNLQDPELVNRCCDERDRFGHFYFRFPNGESGADVYDRVSTFFSTLYRDFEKPDFPPNVVIVTHGLTMRLFLMRWFHWTVEYFESLANPRNCQYVVMSLRDGKYVLDEPLAQWKLPSQRI